MAKKKSYLDDSTVTNPQDMRDDEILQAALDEPALFEILVERYHDPLYRAAFKIVRNPEESEDIVQEAFVKMYKNADKFQKLEGIEFKSWAYKVTINNAITHYRKLKKGEVLSEDPAVFIHATDEDFDSRIWRDSDMKATVATTLEKMPPHLKTVLASYYFDDKSYQMIAKEENISIPTLKMRLFRAKRIFRKLLDEDASLI